MLDRRQVDLPARVGPRAHRQPGDRTVGPELGAGDVRAGLAEHLLADAHDAAHGQDVGQRAGRGELVGDGHRVERQVALHDGRRDGEGVVGQRVAVLLQRHTQLQPRR